MKNRHSAKTEKLTQGIHWQKYTHSEILNFGSYRTSMLYPY